jgi:periplasmic nitrate reductase NapE
MGTTGPRTRWREVLAFLFLAVVVWPVITIGVVAAYGFAVWATQEVYGPPSHGNSGRAR